MIYVLQTERLVRYIFDMSERGDRPGSALSLRVQTAIKKLRRKSCASRIMWAGRN
jgi:hypothetical protein